MRRDSTRRDGGGCGVGRDELRWGSCGGGVGAFVFEAVLPRRRESRLGPRLRGGTVLWCGCCLQLPPRRRPGPSWGTLPTEVCASLLWPFQLGPGLRRGGRKGGGSPGWVPAFAGEHPCVAGAAYNCHPGGGRGPGGGRCQLRSALRYSDLSNRAPAFAGVVRKGAGRRAGSLPLRGNSLLVRVLPKTTTPAEAGAQLGDVAN